MAVSRPTLRWPSLIPGLGLVAIGAFLPSTTLIDLLRGPELSLVPDLVLGGTCFKLGLILLGVATVGLGYYASKTPSPTARAAPRRRSSRNSVALLAGILSVAALLRLYGLQEGLWLDEIVTYTRYSGAAWGELVTTYDSQNQHFLYSILAKATLGVFGDSAWTLRLPAVLLGVASIWATYMVGAQTIGSREGLLAAAFLCFSYHHVWFSQNARGYTGLLFFTLLSSWLLLRGIDKGRTGTWLAFAVATALGFYTHLTMLFVTAGQFSIFLFHSWLRRDRGAQQSLKGILVGFGLAGVLTLQLYALVLPQMFGGTLGQGGSISAWKNPLWALLELVRGINVAFVSAGAGIAAATIFAAGCWRLAREQRSILGLFFVPVFICVAVVFGTGHHLWPRFLFFSAGFVALIVVAGAIAIGQMLAAAARLDRTHEARAGVALSLLLILASATTVPAAYAPKQDYRGALRFVEENREPNDAVVTVGLASYPYQHYYGADWQAVESLDVLKDVCRRAARTWLVYTLPSHLEAIYPDVMRFIEAEFATIQRFHGTLGGGAVVVSRSACTTRSTSQPITSATVSPEL